MKKIGIVTQYYKSTNYGGNLQAYALCEALLKQGYDVEQISYSRKRANRSMLKRLFSGGFAGFYRKCIRHGKTLFQYPFARLEAKKLNL